MDADWDPWPDVRLDPHGEFGMFSSPPRHLDSPPLFSHLIGDGHEQVTFLPKVGAYPQDTLSKFCTNCARVIPNQPDCLYCGAPVHEPKSSVFAGRAAKVVYYDDDLGQYIFEHHDGSHWRAKAGTTEVVGPYGEDPHGLGMLNVPDDWKGWSKLHAAVENRKQGRTARKEYSLAERQAIIDEAGVARNADKLDLDGTHYLNADADEILELMPKFLLGL